MSIMNLSDFHLHSGGARGADTWWAAIGHEFGIPHSNIKHWRPEDYERADDDIKKAIDAAVKRAADGLLRPESFSGVNLVKRNWFQVYNADAIFAIGNIIQPDEKDYRGFRNLADHAVVEGGTGWAVEMAIQAEKPVYVFDMNKIGWWKWEDGKFNQVKPPILTKNFAGIGSRNITNQGVDAIKGVYNLTLNK